MGSGTCHADGAIARQRRISGRGRAKEITLEVVQPSVLLIGATDLERPLADHVRHETNLPIVAAVPESIDRHRFTHRRCELGLELHVLHRIIVRLEADQLALKTGPLGNQSQIFLGNSRHG